MDLLQRIKYSVQLAAVGSSIICLIAALLSSDIIGALSPSVFSLIMSPGYLIVAFIFSFLVAPRVAHIFPSPDCENTTKEQKIKLQNKQTINGLLIAAVGIALILLLQLGIYLLKNKS